MAVMERRRRVKRRDLKAMVGGWDLCAAGGEDEAAEEEEEEGGEDEV